MEIIKLINTGSKELKNKQVLTNNLDSELLLSKVLNKTREELLINLQQQVSKNEINKFVKKIEINIPKIFDVVNSMNSKTSFGGTSAKNVKKMIKKYRSQLK